MGSATDIGYDMYMWTGDLVPGAYYVLVYPKGMKDCLLAVSGAGISF